MRVRSVCMAILGIWLFVAEPVSAQEAEGSNNKTLSPYFFVKSDDAAVDQLPLKATSAAVSIAGVVADVRVTQVYKNEGKKTLEALYVFPASTRAAVYAMKMTIGERTIAAAVREREQARQEYEQAKQQGKSASLLEQQRPNVFQMNVANILPGDEIRVELSYTELLVPEGGVYEFVYPTVVGPRYSGNPEASAQASEKWVQNPYLNPQEKTSTALDITATIEAGMPLQELACASHKVNVTYTGSAYASVKLDPSETAGGNRDYILKYRLAGDAVQTGLLLYPGDKENFFLLMLQPPRRVTDAQTPPREYIFIVDVSGSMHGFPLDVSKALVKNLLAGLRQSDRFNVLLFAGSSSLLSDTLLPATPENIARAVKVIENQSGGGGTELLPALKKALALKEDNKFSRTITIITDGYVTVEKEAFDLISTSIGKANVFAFGIGTSVNRYLIEGLARAGMGEPFVVVNQEEASAKADAFRAYIQHPVLTRAAVQFDGFDAYDVEPAGVPDVFAERPVIIMGKWRGKPKGTITLTGTQGDGHYEARLEAGQVKPLERNAALRYLWARRRIVRLSDYISLESSAERVKEVTELGLAYSLLTQYTSFVAIDSLSRGQGSESATVQQPQPLPQGVSHYAVGGVFHASSREASIMRSFTGSVAMPRKENGTWAMRRDYTDLNRAMPAAPTAQAEKPAAGMVQMYIENITVQGDLSKQAAAKMLQDRLTQVDGCFQAWRIADSTAGKITLKLVVDAAGRVKDIKLMSLKYTQQQLQSLQQCMAPEAGTWSFPAMGSGKEATIEYEFAVSTR